jgi:hypothetical protein
MNMKNKHVLTVHAHHTMFMGGPSQMLGSCMALYHYMKQRNTRGVSARARELY